MIVRKITKSVAKKTPVLGEILKEKDSLYKTTLIQKERIHELEKKNKELHQRVQSSGEQKKNIIWPLLKKQILAANSNHKHEKLAPKHKPPYKLNWVVPAVVPSSGGQADIFRTISYLENEGHTCKIYIFDPTENSNLAEQTKIIKTHFKGIRAEVFYNQTKIGDCDAVFATHWLTAYVVYNFRGVGKKYYYVQGYEPHTQPAGYLSYLAEATYSFGFRGIVLGRWLLEKLSQDYGMKCEYFDFGYDHREYKLTYRGPRKDVLYYAQPQKAHRGFELGIMALEIFHSKNPHSKIHLFGADISNYDISFPYIDHGIMSVEELNTLYNKCAAGLALSFTNISLIPLEMLAAGCLPVINDAYQTRKISYSDMVIYADQNPQAVADALSSAIKSNPNGTMLKVPESYSWDYSNKKIENVITKDLMGKR